MLEATLDAGAEDVNDLGGVVRGGQRGHRPGRGAHRAAGRRASTTTPPRPRSCRACTVELDEDGAGKVFRLIEALEDLDDVQNVFANFDISDDVHGGARRLSRDSGGSPPVLPARRLSRGAVASPVSVVRTGVRTTEEADMRVLGIDPGLTRCGVGVVEGSVGRPLTWSTSGVVRTVRRAARRAAAGADRRGLEQWLDATRPDAVAVERVFSQHNVRTVMGTAQASGIALLVAARRGPPGRHCTRRARSRPRSPAAAAPTRPRSARW